MERFRIGSARGSDVARYLGCDDGPTGPTWVYEPWTRGKARVVITISREG